MKDDDSFNSQQGPPLSGLSGLAYPYCWKGFVGAKKKTSVGLLVYYQYSFMGVRYIIGSTVVGVLVSIHLWITE
jgi:hypothetical protein